MSNSGGRKWNARYFSITDQYLKDNGLRRKSVPRDGCCLFRAVAEQVYLTQTTHWELRRLCANYIRSNPSRFKSFLTVSLKDYCWKLSNCTVSKQLWGGEMELVALSELLEQTITVYQEQDEKIVTQDFCPKKTTQKPKILLLFSGNNHYDTLWSSEEESIASFCQSILYELLIESVMKSRMNQRDLSLAVKLRGGDFNCRYVHCHSLLDRYSHDLLRGLAALSYFNIPYIVYKREKEAREKADRRLAVKMQFTIGDSCQITRDGKQYTGDIVSGLTNSIVNVFVPELRKKVKVSVGEIMLIPQQKSSNAKSKNRLSNYQKSNNTRKEEVISNGRKSYSKSGRVQQDRNQRPPLLEMKEVTTKPIYMKQDNPDVMIGRSVLQDIPTCDKVEQLSTDNNLYEQNTVGFSDTTVRMNSLMGRGNPLELFNQESLASINEAPESEWPILHASGGSGRGRIGNIILSGSNPQRCHLDGPPAPEYSIHQSLLSHNLVAFLVQEMNPPLHLLNTGTPEGRQQFMYEFARRSLQFYSKYVPNSELEGSLTELLRIDFEDFMRTPYNNGDYSVITSSSRDGSQSDIHEHSQSNTPRVSDEDHTSSDTHTDSPAHETTMVFSPSSSTNIITPISPPMEATHVAPISLPNDVESDKEGGVSHEEIPTDSTQHEDSMNIASHFQQPPMMFAPGGPPNPYGFPSYPYPLMFPGPMLPWPYYHPMNGGAAFMIPPQMLPPQMRPQLMEPTHISEEQIKETMGETHEGGSDENVSIEEVHEEDTPVNKQDTPIIKEDSNVPLVASKPSQEENTRVMEQHNVKQVTTTTNNIATAPNGAVEARNRSEGLTIKPKPLKGGGATNKSSVTNSRSRQYNNYTSRRNTKHQYYDYYPNQRKRDVNN